MLTDPSGDAQAVAGLQHGTVDIISCGGVCPTPTATSTPGTPTATPTADGLQTALLFSPGAQTVPFGAEFTIDVNAQNVMNLGAYQVEMEWSPQRFEFVSAQQSSFLGSTGRTVSCQQPVVDVDDIVNPSAVVLRISCNTLGASPPGPNGNGLLVRVRLRNTGSGTTAINFSEDSGLSDPAGDEIPAVHLNNAFVTTGAPTATNTPPSGVGRRIRAPAPPAKDADGCGAERHADAGAGRRVHGDGGRWRGGGGGAVPPPRRAHCARGIGDGRGDRRSVVVCDRRRDCGGRRGARTRRGARGGGGRAGGRREQRLPRQRDRRAVDGDPLPDHRRDAAVRAAFRHRACRAATAISTGAICRSVLSHDGLDCSTDADGDGCANAQEVGHDAAARWRARPATTSGTSST